MANVLQGTISTIIILSAGTCGLYYLAKTIYNIFFHPLSHIPGPWLAAGTYIPEFYHDVIMSGRYTRQIQKMHEKYGQLYCSDRATLQDSHI